MSFKNPKNGRSMSDDLNRQQKDLEHFRSKVLPEKIEFLLIRNTDKAFDDEKYPGKTAWQGRSSKWLSQKSDKADNTFGRSDRRGLLVSSGELRASIETEVSNGEVSTYPDFSI